MRVRRRGLACAAILIVGGTAAAQQPRAADSLVIVHGKVRDAATREPIAGATVSTIDARSSSTNKSGEFSLVTRTGRVTMLVRRIEWGFAADHIATDDTYGIEVDAGPATIPREYASQMADGYCGLVMIWTR